MSTFAEFSDADLLERLDAMMASCLRIWNMPADVRQRASAKGTSPEQFGAVQATMAVAAWNEARRRGLVPDEEL